MKQYFYISEFVHRLNEAMEAMGLNARALSKKSGVSESLISGYRTGRQEPKREKLMALATALNVDPVWLLGEDVPMKKDVLDLSFEEQELVILFRNTDSKTKDMVFQMLRLAQYAYRIGREINENKDS